jgi:hypothetical protein
MPGVAVTSGWISPLAKALLQPEKANITMAQVDIRIIKKGDFIFIGTSCLLFINNLVMDEGILFRR